MNTQQMLDKYKGIIQFQTTIYNNKTSELKLMLLLQMPSLITNFEEARLKANNEEKKSVFYQQGLTDSRILVLVEFCSYTYYSL